MFDESGDTVERRLRSAFTNIDVEYHVQRPRRKGRLHVLPATTRQLHGRSAPMRSPPMRHARMIAHRPGARRRRPALATRCRRLQQRGAREAGRREAAHVPVPAAVRARPVGARAHAARASAAELDRRHAGDGQHLSRGAEVRARARRGVRRQDARRWCSASPQTWVAWLVEALQADARGDAARRANCAPSALERARPRPARSTAKPFEWIADADSRLGPVLEAMVNGRYCLGAVRRPCPASRSRSRSTSATCVWAPRSSLWRTAVKPSR